MRAMLLAAAMAAAPALARDADADASADTQLWTILQAQGPTGWGGTQIVMESQQRTTSDLSRLSVVIFRTGIGGRLAEGLNGFVGYHFQHNDLADDRRSSDEHRLWQQLGGPLLRLPGDIRLAWRARLEERLVEGFDDLGWRARLQLRGTVGDGRRLAPVLWAEGFAGLNSTDWGQQAGRDQVRLFGGASVPIGRRLALEVGYMQQRVFRRSGDRSNHVVSATLNLRL